MTKFDELTDILTDAGQGDFFQATYSEDQIPTSSELAEGLSTNVPASSRIPTVIWKIRIPNVYYKSVNELHYVPSNEGKIRRRIFVILLLKGRHLMNTYFGFYVKLFYRWRMWACKNETIHFSPLKLHPINFCPKFGRWPIQCKTIGLEIKTLPDWYKFFRWFLALSRFGPFTFSLMAWQETKKVILINFRLCTMKFFPLTHQPRAEFQPLCEKYDFPMSIIKA